MSIATEITRLQNAKASIKTSIENKGVTVPSATKLDGYSTLIDAIPSGGGIDLSSIIQADSLQNIGNLFGAFEDDTWDSFEFSCVSGANPILIDFGRAIKGFICYPKNLEILTDLVGEQTALAINFFDEQDAEGNQARIWGFVRIKTAAQAAMLPRVNSFTMKNGVLSLVPPFPTNANYHPFGFNVPYIFVYWW